MTCRWIEETLEEEVLACFALFHQGATFAVFWAQFVVASCFFSGLGEEGGQDAGIEIIDEQTTPCRV